MSDEINKSFIEIIQNEFLEEASYLLDQCEQSYLKLENSQFRQDELRKIFWFCHFLKGAGVSIGYNDLSEFALLAEDLLCTLLVKPELVDLKVVSVLLKVGDLFKFRINSLKTRKDIPWDCRLVAEEVKKLVQKFGGSSITIQDTNVGFNGLKPTSSLELSNLSEKASQVFAEPKGASGSVKIDIERIDAVLDIVGELVVLKSQLINETQQYDANIKLNSLVGLVEKAIRELQNKSLGLRMMPLKHLFVKTQRVVRDLSVKLDKPVIFEMSGEDTEIDRAMVDFLADPLLHIIRNAIDHGIESPRKRQEIGKSPKGKITIFSRQMGGRVIISISDDGDGIHREKILKRVREKKIVAENFNLETLANQDVYQFIFAAGFSTAEFVSEISGRGVGMDVVKSNIEKLKGTIEIQTEPGKGTTFIISIPLTTSITDGMQITTAGQSFILPLDVIRELVDLKGDAITQMHNGQEFLNVRGKLLPILDLAWRLRRNGVLGGACPVESGSEALDRVNSTIVVVESSCGLIALRVQSVIGQVQVVLKSLGGYFSDFQGVAGASILSDGKVALVLDVDHLKFETIKLEVA